MREIPKECPTAAAAAGGKPRTVRGPRRGSGSTLRDSKRRFRRGELSGGDGRISTHGVRGRRGREHLWVDVVLLEEPAQFAPILPRRASCPGHVAPMLA